jgi:acetoacetyl-CoA reductase
MTRVAIVTGGTRGIGAAIAGALKDGGYTVAAGYAGNDEAAKRFTEKTAVRTYRFDVSNFEACEEAVQKVTDESGPVEVLLNNPGITRDGTVHRMSFDALPGGGRQWLHDRFDIIGERRPTHVLRD